MDGVDLMAALFDAMEKCEELLDKLPREGYEMVENERVWRIERQKRILFERTERNTPVSIINSVVDGYPDIADLSARFQCSEVSYNSTHESLLFWKKKMTTVDNLIAREWAREERR